MSFKVIFYLDVVSPILLLVLAAIRRVVFRNDYVLYYVTLQIFLNLLASIVGDVLNYDNNLYVYHLNCLTSFVILSLYFHQIFRHQNYKKVTLIVLGLFFVFFILNIIFWERLDVFNSNTFSVASFILTIYSLIYYLENLTSPPTENIIKSKTFWYTTGLFTYYTCNFFIFITYRKLTQDQVTDANFLWRIHNLVFVIMCVYIFIGIICKPSLKK